MSGIYIPKMEMPKNCEECKCNYYECAFLERSAEEIMEYFGGDKRHPDCPLVEVPKHGGLVDANRLIDIALHLMHTAKNDDIANGVKWLWQYILEAPIIIEAEEGET